MRNGEEMKRGIFTGFVIAMLSGGLLAAEKSDAEMKKQADELAQKFLLVDTHIDVPYRLHKKPEDISRQTEGGEFDYPRAKQGGLNVPFMSVYVPASMESEPDKGFALANELIDLVEGFEQKWPDKFTVVHNSSEAESVLGTGKIGLAMGLENGSPVNGSFENLKKLYERGIRYITLAHSKCNHICDSSYDKERIWNGLSPFGKSLIEEMNHVGIMVDVSHVSDSTFYQVMEISKVPVIASHSSCRFFTPGFERNMSDEMLKRIARGGGVVQINFGSSFIDNEYRKASDALSDEMEKKGLKYGTQEFRNFITEYKKEHPFHVADITKVIEHIEHVIQIAGIDHVGLGSDFDGVGDSLPTGLKDVSQYPNIIYHLLKRGYSETDIQKICGGNLMRVWRDVERYASAYAGH